jgi:hypothetical protein
MHARLARVEQAQRSRPAPIEPAHSAELAALLRSEPDAVQRAAAAVAAGRLRIALDANQYGLPARIALAAWAQTHGDLHDALDTALREAGL